VYGPFLESSKTTFPAKNYYQGENYARCPRYPMGNFCTRAQIEDF
jgi:hypothetical protein